MPDQKLNSCGPNNPSCGGATTPIPGANLAGGLAAASMSPPEQPPSQSPGQSFDRTIPGGTTPIPESSPALGHLMDMSDDVTPTLARLNAQALSHILASGLATNAIIIPGGPLLQVAQRPLGLRRTPAEDRLVKQVLDTTVPTTIFPPPPGVPDAVLVFCELKIEASGNPEGTATLSFTLAPGAKKMPQRWDSDPGQPLKETLKGSQLWGIEGRAGLVAEASDQIVGGQHSDEEKPGEPVEGLLVTGTIELSSNNTSKVYTVGVQVRVSVTLQTAAQGMAHGFVKHFGVGSPGIRDAKGDLLSIDKTRFQYRNPPSAEQEFNKVNYGPGWIVSAYGDPSNPKLLNTDPPGPPKSGGPVQLLEEASLRSGGRAQIFEAEVTLISAMTRGRNQPTYVPGRALTAILMEVQMRAFTVS